MPHYQFAVHDDGGTQSETLVGKALPDDASASDFGKRVVKELMYRVPGRYTGWTMKIIEDKRSVASVPFEPDATQSQKK